MQRMVDYRHYYIVSNLCLFLFAVLSLLCIVSCGHKSNPFPIVHIYYNTLIEDYSVIIDWYPTDRKPISAGEIVLAEYGPADITLLNEKNGKKYVLTEECITIPNWLFEHKIQDEETITLDYLPFESNEIIPPGTDQLVFFADIDYDGNKEIVINCYKGGAQGANKYVAYKIVSGEVEKVTYAPFYGKEERFEDYRIKFHIEDNTVESLRGTGPDTYSILYEFDGTGNKPGIQ